MYYQISFNQHEEILMTFIKQVKILYGYDVFIKEKNMSFIIS